VISVTTGGPLERRLPADVAVHCMHKPPGIDARFVVRLARRFRTLRPEVVHSRNWSTLDAVLAARLARVPVVIHGEHGREATDPQGLDGRRRRVRRLAAPLITRFVTVSFDLSRWLVDIVGVPPRKIETIHNGVDLADFASDGRDAGRRVLGIGGDTVVFGSIGRLDPVKDHLGLIDAFARLEQRETRLVIVGDGPCRRALEERCARRDVAGRVHLLGERDDVPALLAVMDVYVLASIAEGISNTILEAMASALPVVATRTGGNPELVEDGVTGALVPVGDPAALARALSTYADDPHVRDLQGKAGRRRATEEFGLERMAARYRRLYVDLTRGVA
jgi:sugar transferase (PEP-CTERM/EpsH1 system associated)